MTSFYDRYRRRLKSKRNRAGFLAQTAPTVVPSQWYGQFPCELSCTIESAVERVRALLDAMSRLFLWSAAHRSAAAFKGQPFVFVLLFFTDDCGDQANICQELTLRIREIVTEETPSKPVIGPSVWQRLRQPWPPPDALGDDLAAATT
jgi:hypothetical protein